MSQPAFELLQPDRVTTGAVFSSPHSGRQYPPEFLSKSDLDFLALRSSEDAFIDQLFGEVPAMGAPLLCATYPRAYVDLNRGADELDPALIDGIVVRGNNPRVAAGLGVIPRVVSAGRMIRRGKMSVDEAQARIAQCYRPYHAQLSHLLDRAKSEFGHALLVDCHSMPNAALAHSTAVFGSRPEVVIGDRFGAACDPDIVEAVEACFASAGFRVTRNAPFAGAFITQAYGRPDKGRSVVQVEIDRSLYMDEATLTPHDGFEAVKAALSQAASGVVEIMRGQQVLAAE